MRSVDLQSRRVSLRLPVEAGYVDFEELAVGQCYWAKVRTMPNFRFDLFAMCVPILTMSADLKSSNNDKSRREEVECQDSRRGGNTWPHVRKLEQPRRFGSE